MRTDDVRDASVRSRTVALAMVVALALSACTHSQAGGGDSTAEQLQKAYGGELSCIESVVEAASGPTREQLARVAKEGLVGEWLETDTIAALESLSRRCGMLNG